MSKKNCTVGGQAVIEGVMMRGKSGIATAVRKNDGEISVDFEENIPLAKRNKFFGIPIIRGFVSLIESMSIGIRALNYSASFFEDDEVEASKFDKWFENTFKDKANDIIIVFSLIISFIITILLFILFPNIIAGIFKKVGINNIFILNVIEGILRVIIFITYIFLISKMEDIDRTFQYHGAEHKTIFCYESDCELTSENAEKFERFHPRCGTNFLFLVMIVSIIMFSLVGWDSIWKRTLYRILLFPLISGISYELIKWMGKSNTKLSSIIAYPGLKLQRITTKEPSLDMIEVAIKALKVSEGIED